jgi:hypothetical protein
MSVRNHISRLQSEHQRQLREAAIDYLRTGLDLFRRYRRKTAIDHPQPIIVVDPEYNNPQAALGNLAISVELMLKAIIAGKSLLLLFKNLPLEFRVLLTLPDNLPPDFNWRAFEMDLRSANCKAIEFDECVSIFYVFFPSLKQSLQSHLKFLSGLRNASVHSILPPFSRFEVERAAYVAIHVHKVLNDTLDTSGLDFLSYTGYVLSDEDRDFVATFQGERLNRVKKKIDDAKKDSKRLAGQRVTRTTDDWDHYVTSCPICDNDVVLEGCTKEDEIRYGEDDFEMMLRFFPSSYRCPECGLTLDDFDELQIAGIPIQFDRSDEIDEYLATHKPLSIPR